MTKSRSRNKNKAAVVEDVKHRLRPWVRIAEDEISDEELDEVERHITVDNFLSFYEYAGNFILSSMVEERDEAVRHMCCGIITRDIQLDSGRWLYFAFDYGH